MLNQSFSKKNLRYTSIKTWKKHATTSNYRDFLKNTIDQISIKNSDNGYAFSKFVKNKYKNKIGYDFTCPEDEVIAQKVNDNLRRLFKVKPSDRHAIVKQTISLAKDSQPFTVARIDIKDFYESLKRKEIINFITNEWLLSHQSKLALKNWDKQLNAQGVTGLPRGMSLSSTLSEIKMRSYDKSIKREEGVYFYARYVDDIIIFYSGGVDNLKNIITQNLSIKAPELHINFNKSQFYTFNDTGVSQNFDIDYLGYKISAVSNPSKKQNQRKVSVSISDKKIRKIKNRIRKSFTSYSRERNFDLLIARLKFLSGNQYIIGDIERTKLKSGIYYNYPLITEFHQLKELDIYYKKLINTKHQPVHQAIQLIKNHGGHLNNSRIEQINNISFSFGFHKRLMNSFTNNISKKIKRCW